MNPFVPESHLAKDRAAQDGRELTFILQEAALSQGIPLYCTIDRSLLDGDVKTLFTCEEFEVKADVLWGCLPLSPKAEKIRSRFTREQLRILI